MTQYFSNNAEGTLSVELSSVATSLVLQAGEGALFSSPVAPDFELVTLEDSGTIEIVKVTSRATDTLTIERAQEGTSAALFPVGSVAAGRVTAGTLDTLNNKLTVDNGGDAIGTNSISVQPNRVNTSSTATGNTSVAVGYDSTSAGTSSVAMGHSSEATGSHSIAIGSISASTSSYSVAVGSSSAASGLYSLAVGYQASAPDNSSVAIGKTATSSTTGVAIGVDASCTFLGSVAIGSASADSALNAVAVGRDSLAGDAAISVGFSSSAPGSKAIAIGTSTDAIGASSVCIGSNSDTSGDSGTAVGVSADAFTNASALGKSSKALGSSSIAIGSSAEATGTSSVAMGVGAQARSLRGVAIGSGAQNYIVQNAISTAGLPITHHPFNWWTGNEAFSNTGLIGTLISEPLDLTGGSTWLASTPYNHGDVIKPTTPNGFQYLWYDNGFDIWSDPDLSGYTPGSSEASEPTWPVVSGDSYDGANGSWIAVSNSAYTIALHADFLIEEVLFIAYNCSGISSQANISIGQVGSLTKAVNNQPTVSLLADKDVTKWTLAQPVLLSDITISIDTLAVGTQMLGNFVFKGFYAKWGNS